MGRGVLRLLQRLTVGPRPAGILRREDVRGPSGLPNHFLRDLDLAIILRPIEKLRECEIPNGRLILLEQPIEGGIRPPGHAYRLRLSVPRRWEFLPTSLWRKHGITWSLTIPTACIYA